MGIYVIIKIIDYHLTLSINTSVFIFWHIGCIFLD